MSAGGERADRKLHVDARLVILQALEMTEKVLHVAVRDGVVIGIVKLHHRLCNLCLLGLLNRVVRVGHDALER